MSVRTAKLRSRLDSIKRYGDKPDDLRAFAEHLLRVVDELSLAQLQPENYRVLSPMWHGPHAWFEVASGGKLYCIGYADAQSNGSIVACGRFVCYPEESYGDEVEGDIGP